MNKASGDDGVPAELFQILKDDAVKCYTQHASKFKKLNSCHRTVKGQISFQSEGKVKTKMFKLPHKGHLFHTSRIMLFTSKAVLLLVALVVLLLY